MPDQQIHVNINQMEILAPVVAAQLTTAVFTSAVLDQLRGAKIDDLYSDVAINRVLDVWMAFWKALEKGALKDKLGDQRT